MLEIIKQQEIILNIIKKTDNLSVIQDITDEKLAFFRDDIRKNIFFLQQELLEQYSDTILKYILFPLIAYVDEKIMFKSSEGDFKWKILQLEYYNKDDGGQYVYEIVDNLLSDDIYPRICYEVIFLILDAGFQGKFFEKTYDHQYVSYKKKICKIISNQKDNDLIISDSTKIFNNRRKSNRHTSNMIKFMVPVVLFGISLLVLLL